MIVGRRCTWIMADGQGLVCGHHLGCMKREGDGYRFVRSRHIITMYVCI